MDKQLLFLITIIIIASIVSSILVFLISLKAAFLGMIIVVIMAVAYQYPRKSLWAFLIYLPFGGTVTYSLGSVYYALGSKVSYSSEYPLFHLAKDSLYLPSLIALALTTYFFKELRLKYPALTLAILIFAGLCLVTLFGVNLPESLETKNFYIFGMGLIGLKIFIGYIPLIACGYYLIRNKQDLLLLNRLQIGLILICCGLCLVQLILLKTGICPGNINLPGEASNRASLQAHCFVGGSLLYNPSLQLIRLPGTFVAPWQWGWFLIFSSFFVYGVILSDPAKKWRLTSIITLIFLLFITLVSGQRVALVLVPIILLILLLITEKNKLIIPIKFGSISLILILIVSNIQFLQQRIDSLAGRWNASPPLEFIVKQLDWVITENLSLIGLGLGKTASAARRLGDIQLIETFYANLLYEIGLLGTISFLILVSILTVLTFKSYRSLKDPDLKNIGLCLWLFVLLISYNTYYYPLMVDPIAVYYWFFAGVLLKLPQLESN